MRQKKLESFNKNEINFYNRLQNLIINIKYNINDEIISGIK